MVKISRRAFIAGSGALLATALGLYFRPFRKMQTARPNIILFIADDMRYDATGYAGNAIVKTPHLDALAAVSTNFRNHFVTTSICPTSRASIFTGLYALRHKVYDFKKALKRRHSDNMFPVLLRDEGYYTGFIGKWGIGGKMPKHEFDHWMGYAGQGKYYGRSKTHMTVRQARKARKFFAERPYDKPYLLVVSFKAPHGPWQSQKKFRAMYKGVRIPRHSTDTPEDFNKQPFLLRKSFGRHTYRQEIPKAKDYQKFMHNYYGLISGLDKAVGDILSMPEVQRENTAVLFTSDNGLMNGEHGLMGKFCMYESSIRTPMLVHLPGNITGRTMDDFSLNIDIAPTILSIAGVPVPDGMQGRSMLERMRDTTGSARDGFYYYHPKDPVHRRGTMRNVLACDGYRNGQYKYAKYRHKKIKMEMLFDLQHDPLEQHNLAGKAEYAELLKRMRKLTKTEKQKVA